ncbi:acetylcholinesterase collagenic tail peptide-like [Centropristis striata]|uniref:acetylcholinesterase collagenic tail peptide-like n=1 Tax=Centropristis striata TaxID=184440 RepID=UPI0027E0EE87|nr:acetylcholinesterase collagenic tail peptide-like [Centropristis striata]
MEISRTQQRASPADLAPGAGSSSNRHLLQDGRATAEQSRRGDEMLTQLFLGWTALLSGLQPAAASITTRLLSNRRLSSLRCSVFIPPPPPPPVFPTVKRQAELMVDITELITGLKGEKGCRGPRGPRGPPGVTGPAAEPGAQGPLGQLGPKGEKGDRGWRGLYGDIGTPGMIKGSKGRKGFRGEKGVKGTRGARGETGDPGQWGDAGQRGEPGPRGEPGSRGGLGFKGSQGLAGKPGHSGPAGLSGQTGDPGLPGQVYVLPGLQGDSGEPGPVATCNCSKVQTPKPLKDRVQTIFVADGERQMRRLRGENVMVLRTDKKALYIYSQSQWINVLVTPPAPQTPHLTVRF